MPRPKGKKNDKNQLTSSFSTFQTSINLTNDSMNDDLNVMKSSKIGRPKKIEILNGNDDYLGESSPISSTSEIAGGRVIINPAVLRYLEQNNRNRNSIEHDEILTKNIQIDKDDDHLFQSPLNHLNLSKTDLFQVDKIGDDEFFWDFPTYPTDFLTSARLAQWILTNRKL